MTIKAFKNHRLYKVICTLAFCALTVGLLSAVTDIFRNKSEDALSREYQEFPRDTFDVIFLGSSVMLNDVYPLQLYQDYGIASYNLGCGSQSVASSYYLAKLVIEQQKPELIVFDCNMCQEGLVYSSEEKFHYVTDALSLAEKREMVTELVPRDSWINFFFEMNLYHDRWKELGRRDFTRPECRTYGAKVHFVSHPLGEYVITEEKAPLPEVSEEYLRKIIKLCQENQVELLLTVLPMNFSARYDIYDRNEWQKYYNTIQDIADEAGIQYLNFMYHTEETGLDPAKDFEGDTHLNGWGAPKMTDYLGKYLRQHYELPDVREDSAYDFMAEDYVKFVEYKDRLEAEQAGR